MNEHQRNQVIAKGEDTALDVFLKNRDANELNDPCECCEEKETYIEFNDVRMCQSCYEDAGERAEMLADNQEDE